MDIVYCLIEDQYHPRVGASNAGSFSLVMLQSILISALADDFADNDRFVRAALPPFFADCVNLTQMRKQLFRQYQSAILDGTVFFEERPPHTGVAPERSYLFLRRYRFEPDVRQEIVSDANIFDSVHSHSFPGVTPFSVSSFVPQTP